MKIISQVEEKLSGLFKDLPKLPESSKESLVQIWPWLALIGGLVQLWAAWALKELTDVTNSYVDFANSISQAYLGKTVGLSGMDKTVIYAGIIILAVDAVILLMAFSPLKTRLRKGWDLLFLASLLNAGYGVVSIFMHGRGFGSFIGSLVGSAIGLYLLFQVKDKYKTTSDAKPNKTK